ncbi:MAG: 16S rRNA (cytosine(1402)-N(4))-methyltransferase RsmH [Candidatus Lambdaproteobacteria bacterium]|nr:16S rRNA (cytosine(1402)-N(4))-methyltransferase RsmH [Candidatus Lambdaproteobacteria bacterium]
MGESFRHQPVLLEAVRGLVPAGARLLADVTLGGAGHALALLEDHPQAELFGSDRDPAAVAAAAERLAPFRARILLKHLRFSQVGGHLPAGGVDFLLADLGLSSPQVDEAGRGFSFTRDGPLDMRMDPTGGAPSALELVNRAKPERLREILQTYGEERFAARIARAIAEQRQRAPIATTGALAAIVSAAVPRKFHRHLHPATRTFQALRMEVNDELGELEALLAMAPDLLAPGGRLAIISFHSLEDRLVKTRFRTWADPCVCPPRMPACVCGRTPLGRILTRKPLTASAAEQARNPRSRSAKLRAFERTAAP